MRGKKITFETAEKMRQLYINGNRLEAIANYYGVSVDAVRRNIRENRNKRRS